MFISTLNNIVISMPFSTKAKKKSLQELAPTKL